MQDTNDTSDPVAECKTDEPKVDQPTPEQLQADLARGAKAEEEQDKINAAIEAEEARQAELQKQQEHIKTALKAAQDAGLDPNAFGTQLWVENKVRELNGDPPVVPDENWRDKLVGDVDKAVAADYDGAFIITVLYHPENGYIVNLHDTAGVKSLNLKNNAHLVGWLVRQHFNDLVLLSARMMGLQPETPAAPKIEVAKQAPIVGPDGKPLN